MSYTSSKSDSYTLYTGIYSTAAYTMIDTLLKYLANLKIGELYKHDLLYETHIQMAHNKEIVISIGFRTPTKAIFRLLNSTGEWFMQFLANDIQLLLDTYPEKITNGKFKFSAQLNTRIDGYVEYSNLKESIPVNLLKALQHSLDPDTYKCSAKNDLYLIKGAPLDPVKEEYVHMIVRDYIRLEDNYYDFYYDLTQDELNEISDKQICKTKELTDLLDGDEIASKAMLFHKDMFVF